MVEKRRRRPKGRFQQAVERYQDEMRREADGAPWINVNGQPYQPLQRPKKKK